MASSTTGARGEKRQDRRAKRGRGPRRLSGFSRVFAASRWVAVLVSLAVALAGLSEARRQMAVLLPWTVEAFLGALFFCAAFFVSWGWGTLGAILGWSTGRRQGWPEAGAWGGVVGLWLGCGLWWLLRRWVGGWGGPPLQGLVVVLLGLSLPPLLAWAGARWGPPACQRSIVPLLRRQQRFSRWFAERLLLRRPFRLDLRGVAVGTAAGLIAMALTVTGAFEYLEAVSLASRIRLRDEAVITPAGSLEWSRWLSLLTRGLAPDREQRIVLVDLDDATIAQIAAVSSEPWVQQQMLARLEAWGARQVVLPVSGTVPVQPGGDVLPWLTRRPPLDDTAYRRALADLPGLGEAIRQCACVILCVLPDNPLPSASAHPRRGPGPPGHRRRPPFREAGVGREGPPPPPDAPVPIRPVPAFDLLLRDARAVGSAEFDLFHVRQLPLLRPRDRAGRPSVPSLLAWKQGGRGPARPLIVNVFGSAPGALFTHVSYASVLEGRPIYDRTRSRWLSPPQFFRNRIVFLDTLRQPLLDTPVGQFTATELLAMATDNLMTGSVLTRPARVVQFPLMLLMGALVGSLAIRRSPLRAALRLATVAGIYVVVAVGLFVVPGLWVPIVPVVVAAVLAYLMVAQFVYSADQDERERERAARMRVDQELTIGHEIQTSLLPVGRRDMLPAGSRPDREPRAASREPPAGEFVESYGSFVVAARSDLAREVGGDFYDVFSLAEDRLALVLGDVSGKGVPGALFMAVTTTLLQAYARLIEAPDEVLARANEELYPKMRGALGARRRHAAMFVTAFYGILETGSGRLRYASAGQIPPILAGPGRDARYLPARGAALGGVRVPRTLSGAGRSAGACLRRLRGSDDPRGPAARRGARLRPLPEAYRPPRPPGADCVRRGDLCRPPPPAQRRPRARRPHARGAPLSESERDFIRR